MYKRVGLYEDEKSNLYLVPLGETAVNRYDKEIDAIVFVNYPYTDEELYRKIREAFERCYSIIPDEGNLPTPLEKLFKVKGYKKATRNKKYVSLYWNNEDGYSVTPTKKDSYGAYDHLLDHTFELGREPTSDAFARAIHDALCLSTT